MDMVERVAKAIFQAWAEGEGSDATWDEIVRVKDDPDFPKLQKLYRLAMAEARAAIAIMREPTVDMKIAGLDAVFGGVDAVPDGPIEIQSDTGAVVWRYMIDAALKPLPL